MQMHIMISIHGTILYQPTDTPSRALGKSVDVHDIAQVAGEGFL